MDAEGYINIVGRIKDMTIRGGENVYPREIEEFLYTHPKISDVQVIGVPDPKYGEEIMAWVKVLPGEQVTAEELQAYCKGQIAHFKSATLLQVCGGFSDDRHRQDSEVPYARAVDRGTGAAERSIN